MNRFCKIFFAFLVCCPIMLFPQSNYQKGWEAFNNNQRSKAIQLFQVATNDAKDAAEAWLSLSLMYYHIDNQTEALNAFLKFYNLVSEPYPYLYAMFTEISARPASAVNKELLGFYENLLTDNNISGTLKAMILQEIGDYYLAINQLKKAKQYYAQIGAIKDWQVLGLFDNISGSGFNKDWGAVAKAKATETFQNKVNASIYWTNPGENKEDGWFDFGYVLPYDHDIMYAQTFVNSAKNQEVILRVGVSGSLKFWVNDALVLSIEQERNCDMDIYACKIKLNQGDNRLLIQIGQSEISSANFLVRLTDEQAYPVSDLKATAKYADYQKDHKTYNTESKDFFAETYFENKIKQQPDNFLYYKLLSSIYLRNDKAYFGMHVLKQAEEKAPLSSFFKSNLLEAYHRAGYTTEVSRMEEYINQNDPESYFALLNKYDEYADADKYNEAEEVLKKIKKLYGENRKTANLEINIINKLKGIEPLIPLLVDLYKKYPYDYTLMSNNVYVQKEVLGNAKTAQNILKAYCKKYANMSAWNDLATEYFNQGKITEGMAMLKQRLNYYPYAVGWKLSYIKTLQQLRQYNEALLVLKEMKEKLPFIPSVRQREGDIYKEMNNKEMAQKAYKQTIYLSPTNYEARKQLRLINNQKEIFELFPQANLDFEIAKNLTEKDYPDANAMLLMYDDQRIFYPEGATEERYEIAIKILNKKGIEDWKDYQITYYNNQALNLDKYEIIKANGQKVKAETNQKGRVVFTNLEVGDVLHLIYRLQNYNSGVLAKHIYGKELLQYSLPASFIRHAILMPKDMDLQHLVKNTSTITFTQAIEDMILYEWTVSNQQKIKDEPYQPPFGDIAPIVIYSSIPNWDFIVNWYKDLTSNVFNTFHDYIFNETYQEIIQGHEGDAPLAKAKLFYEYILNNITYSQVPFLQNGLIPQKPSRTIATKLGDCKDVSSLFVAFCRKAGIAANLVLLQSRYNSSNILALPSIDFEHCIAQFNIDGKIYYTELTASKLPFCALPEEDLNANMLLIPFTNTDNELINGNINSKETVSFLQTLDMPQRIPNAVIRSQEINIEENAIKSMKIGIRTGEWASSIRYRYYKISEEEQLKIMQESVAEDWSIPVKISNLHFENLDNLKDTVIYSFFLDAPGALQDVVDMKIFKLPWTDAITSMSEISAEERKYPFLFWQYFYSDYQSEEISLNIPKNKKLASNLSNVTLECSVAKYELTFTVTTNNQLIAKRTLSKKKDIVEPSEYKEYQEFIKKVSENDNKQIAIK